MVIATDTRVAALVVQRASRVRRTFKAGSGAQVFTDGFDLMVGHVMKHWPRHDLEKAAVVGRWKAVQRSGSWGNGCAGEVEVIEINTSP